MNPTSIRKTLIASSVALALGAPSAEAAIINNFFGPYTFSTDSANLTMLAANGGVLLGTNDVKMVWDGNGYNSSSDYTGPGSPANVTASSTTPFLGHAWTAHDIQVFAPGSYSFNTALGGGSPESGILNITVPTGDLGMHMLFDWNGNNNIDMFVVAALNSIFGSGLLESTQPHSAFGASACDVNYTGTIVKNCLYDGPNYGSAGAPSKNQVWNLASVDGNGDGVMGIPMAAGGPFGGYSANISANLNVVQQVVPVPAAAWLFGSGLLGLIGAARRRIR